MVEQEIRQLLEKRLKELLNLLDRLQQESNGKASREILPVGIEDTIDTATALAEKESVHTQIINVTDQLAMTRHALHKMDHFPDRFGKCELCMRAIEQERLKIKPWARYCKSCRESIEKRTSRK
jgi:DnaK suppressor protein